MEFEGNRLIVPADISLEELAKIIDKYSGKYIICIGNESDENTNSEG